MGKRANGEGSIYQRKDGRWVASATVGRRTDGKPKLRKLYGHTQQEARAKLEELKRQIGTGTYSDARQSVSDFLDEWLREKVRQVKPSTYDQYVYCVENHLKPTVGHHKLTKLNPMQVQSMVRQVADSAGVPTANKCRVVLHNAYKLALRWQLVSRNPVEAVDPLPQQVRQMKLWTPEQASRFLDTARTHRLYALFYLAMSTGLRRGELLGLRWQDVKADRLLVRQTLMKGSDGLRVDTPKTKAGMRVVGITPDVAEVLQKHRQRQEADRAHLVGAWPETGLVFVSEVGSPLDPDNLKRVRRNLMEAAGVPVVRLHDLRHLHASLAIRNGTGPKELADRLGHASASFTLDRYVHLFEEQRAQSAVSLTAFLQSGHGAPN